MTFIEKSEENSIFMKNSVSKLAQCFDVVKSLTILKDFILCLWIFIEEIHIGILYLNDGSRNKQT